MSPGITESVVYEYPQEFSRGNSAEGPNYCRDVGGDGQITVRMIDTGIGIAPDSLARIFDFGFQSSGSRVKMGSGLSTAYNILQSHKGEIRIDSVEGEGRTVILLLPTEGSTNT